MVRSSCLFLLTIAAASIIDPPQSVYAASLRCPDAQIISEKEADVTQEELEAIKKLWLDLDSDTKGSNGPLGCPMNNAQTIQDVPSSWGGVRQAFQRGEILIGRGSSLGTQLVAVRGLDDWWIWHNGFGPGLHVIDPSQPPDHILTSVTPDGWARGGFVVTGSPSKEVALWRCGNEFLSICMIETPKISAIADDRTFDLAARLEPFDLLFPDVNKLDQRRDAIFASWLPCFTRVPHSSDVIEHSVGEAEIATAQIMMRRSKPCDVTGHIPRSEATNWLYGLKMKSYPGTSWDRETDPIFGMPIVLERPGELDVALVQLLKLMLRYKLGFHAQAEETLGNELRKWGGPPRDNPYVAPDALVGGYMVIETENHILLQETARYLINEYVIRGKKAVSGNFNEPNRDWLLRFLQQIIRRDFYEFNALPYTRYQVKALLALHDYAPDEGVRVAAQGVLDWLFIKAALSSSLDRDYRPYRRIPDAKIYDSQPWWGPGATSTTLQLAVLAGPLQHVADSSQFSATPGAISLLADKSFCQIDKLKNPYCAVQSFPNLGTIRTYFKEALIDIADSEYRLPRPLGQWAEERYTRDDVNRVTYFQAINHTTKISEDPRLFKQENSGAEVMSGNRNWTITGGGSPAPPGDPGPPPGIVPIADATAKEKQAQALWSGQPGMLRKTLLIPTPNSPNRGQTIGFGTESLTKLNDITARLCVADGFLCGYDLQFPANPFPRSESGGCVMEGEEVPPPVETFMQTMVSGVITLKQALGCQLKRGGQFGWTSWTFEHGVLTYQANPAPFTQPRFAVAWIENPQASDRVLHVSWKGAPGYLGYGFDTYQVRAYAHEVRLLPSGSLGPGLQLEGFIPKDVRANEITPALSSRSFEGEFVFPLKDVDDVNWQLLIFGCYFPGSGISKDYDGYVICDINLYPTLRVSLAIPPEEPFSCEAHRVPPPSNFDPSHSAPRQGDDVVMTVGSPCPKSDSPYGLYLYVWHEPCTAACQNPNSLPGVPEGLNGPSDYGFIIAAPSRGWKSDEFMTMVLNSIEEFKKISKHDYDPSRDGTVGVPISPPVKRVDLVSPTGERKTGWEPTGSPSKHTLTFHWPQPGTASIMADTATTIFSQLAGSPATWPLAVGYIQNPETSSVAPLLNSEGNGCFTFGGLPTMTNPQPVGLMVDMRDALHPAIREIPGAKLTTACQ